MSGHVSFHGRHYFCWNCGGVEHEDRWILLQRREDHEEDEFRPSEPGEMDPFLKCPCCGEINGDCHYGAGIEEGTKAEMEALRDKHAPEYAKEWLAAVAEVAADDQPAVSSPSNSKDSATSKKRGEQ